MPTMRSTRRPSALLRAPIVAQASTVLRIGNHVRLEGPVDEVIATAVGGVADVVDRSKTNHQQGREVDVPRLRVCGDRLTVDGWWTGVA